MLGWVLAILGVSDAFVHGTLGRDQTRQLTHRWRPDAISLPGSESFVNAYMLNSYVRARIHTEASVCFGIVSQDSDDKLAVFVLHQDGDVHALKAILWGTRDRCEDRLRELVRWHGSEFPMYSLVADLDGVEDDELWRKARQSR